MTRRWYGVGLSLAFLPTCGLFSIETPEHSGGGAAAQAAAGGTSAGGSSGGSVAGGGGAGGADSVTCEDAVGSVDCELLAQLSSELTLARCLACQGSACGSNPDDGCDEFPCQAGVHIVRGCCDDAQCSDLSPFCGKHIATNYTCVKTDDR